MNILYYLQQKQMVPASVMESLIETLTKGCRKSLKRDLRSHLENRLYSLLDLPHLPWESFKIESGQTNFYPKSVVTKNAEIAVIRKAIILYCEK